MILDMIGKYNARTSVLVALYLLLSSSQVLAHAVLLETSPANRDVLEVPPEEIVVRFNEPVSPARVMLLNQDGVEVALGDIRNVNEEFRFSTVSPLVEGQYILSFRVISLDAHPISASVGFSIGNLPPPMPTISDADTVTRTLLRLNQVIHLLVVLACIGLVLFPLIFIMPENLEGVRLRVLMVISIIGMITAILDMGLWGVLLSGEGISAILELKTWSQISATTLGTSTGLVTGGLVGILLSISLGAEFTPGRYLGLFGVVLILISFAVSGHAATSGLIFKPFFFIHVLMAGIWFGALIILYRLISSEESSIIKPILKHFSTRAMILVGVLLVCALILTLHLIGDITILFNSDYGILLLLKILLVTLVLLFAAVNRWYYIPKLQGHASTANIKLRRSIGIETFLMVLIIAVTMVLASTSPPDENDSQTPTTMTVTGSQGLIANLAVYPLRTGDNTLDVAFYQGEEMLVPLEVTVRWWQEETGIEPMELPAFWTEEGIARVEDLEFLIPGEWTLRLNVLIDEFTSQRLETTVLVE